MAVMVLLGVGVGAFLLSRTGAAAPAPRPGLPTQSTTQSAPPPTAPTTVPTTAPTTAPMTAPTSPGRALEQQISADRPNAEAVVDYWVPQLSSKRLGTVADGITYGYADILADFRSLDARFPDAVLVRSDDYVSFSRGGFYVTVVAQPFSTPEQANAWCDSYGLAADTCYAKRSSHTDRSAGSTVLR